MSPRDAARAFCVKCLDAKDFRAGACNVKIVGSTGPVCRLYGITHTNAPRPLKAIKLECLCCKGHVESDTTGHNVAVRAVEMCRSYECPLHDFREGRNPNYAGRGRASNFGARSRI
jgi:hypothetical protein